MKTLKTVAKNQVHLLMDFDYNNVYGRIKFVLDKEAVLFSDIHIKNTEIHWLVRNDAEYVALPELPYEKVTKAKKILSERISYVRSVLSGDSLIGDYVNKILTYPSDGFVFVRELDGKVDVVIAGWGCEYSVHGNENVSHTEACGEECPTDHASDNVQNFNNSYASEQESYNNDAVNNEPAFILQGTDDQQVLVCPRCMTTYPAGSSFCPRDGERLINSDNLTYCCEKCGTEYDSEIKFCPKDGAAVVCRIAGQHYPSQSDARISMEKASLGSRFVASLLDGLIGFALTIPAIVFCAIGFSNVTYNYDYYYEDYSKAYGYFVCAFILYLIPLTYNFIKDGLGNGQSWGKKAMGLRTIKVNDYSKCTKGVSALRTLVSIVISMVPFVGWIIEPIMVLLTSDGRRLADKAAGTMVVNA